MSNSVHIRHIVKALPGIGSRALLLVQRIASLEAQVTDLHAMLATSRVHGPAGDGIAASGDVQAMLIRAANVVEELDRLGAMYESLALRIAVQEAEDLAVKVSAVSMPQAPACSSAPDAGIEAERHRAANNPGSVIVHRSVRIGDANTAIASGNAALSPEGVRRRDGLVAEWNELQRQCAAMRGLRGRIALLLRNTREADDARGRMNALFGQVAKEYAGKVEAVALLLGQNRELNAQVDRVAKEYAAKADQAGRLLGLNRELNAEVDRVAKECAAKADEAGRLLGLNHELNAEVDRVAKECAAKADEAARLLARNSQLNTELDRVTKEYATKVGEAERQLDQNSQLNTSLDKVAKEYAAKEARADQLLGQVNELSAELGQFKKEYNRKVEAHELVLNQSHELLRHLQEDLRTAGLRSSSWPGPRMRSPEYPPSISGHLGTLPIRVIDVGAQSLISEPHVYAAMQAACEIVGFEPLMEAAERRAAVEPGVRMFNHVIGRGGKGTFRVTRFDPASSLLEADATFLDQFMALPEMYAPVRQFDVETMRLDDIPEVTDCDYLKLDVQGGELDVLKGAARLLKGVIFVHTEVEFAPVYRNQPLFADVDEFLRESGFELIDLMKFGYAGYKELPSRRSTSRLMWCDAVYCKRPSLLAHLPAEKLLKGAYIAHVNYGLLDLAAHLLAQHGSVAGGSLLADYVASV